MVAEPSARGLAASAFLEVQSDGAGFQLREAIQDSRPRGDEERSRGADDRLAALVAGRLRTLRTAVHSYGMAQVRTAPVTAAAAAAEASSALRRSIVGRTTRVSIKRDACSGQSNKSMAARFPGPT